MARTRMVHSNLLVVIINIIMVMMIVLEALWVLLRFVIWEAQFMMLMMMIWPIFQLIHIVPPKGRPLPKLLKIIWHQLWWSSIIMMVNTGSKVKHISLTILVVLVILLIIVTSKQFMPKVELMTTSKTCVRRMMMVRTRQISTPQRGMSWHFLHFFQLALDG